MEPAITDRGAWRANWQREIEGAYLYGELARAARTPQVKQALDQMGAQELEHAHVWAEHLSKAGIEVKKPQPDLRIFMMAWLGRWLGAEAVLGLLINDEVSDIASYAGQSRQLGEADTYRRVLADETAHARALATLRSRNHGDASVAAVEPWHRGLSAGGFLREIVYGFNDGLTANFGLVMGVVGAAVNNRVILLAGFAGLLAGRALDGGQRLSGSPVRAGGAALPSLTRESRAPADARGGTPGAGGLLPAQGADS